MSEACPEISVVDHQQAVEVPEDWLEVLEKVLRFAWEAQAAAKGAATAPDGVGELDVSLLDDSVMGEVHGRFMDDPTPTDVITFEHGEILIGVETAVRQAAEHGEPLLRELARYAIHGVLHLWGHDDLVEEDRAVMEREQERIVAAAHFLVGS